MKKIVVTRNDGGVSIIIPSIDATPETLERDALRVNGYVSHREVDDENIPNDRTFRNAWTDENPTETIDVDINKAKEIHLNTLRELRKPKLKQLDVDFMKAVEQGNSEEIASIAAQKQELRDLPETLDLSKITDPEVLKNIIPDCLQGE